LCISIEIEKKTKRQHIIGPHTLKKKELYRTSKKGSVDFKKLANVFKLPKKRKKKLRNLKKDLPVYPGEDPFFLETFLSSVQQKKGFV
jgi:hypothetical protein